VGVNEIASFLARLGTVIISSSNAIFKTAFLLSLVDHFLDRGRAVDYLDCDLLFSSRIAQERSHCRPMLRLIVPDSHDVLNSTISLVSIPRSLADPRDQGLLVVDSLNMLQNLLRAAASVDAMIANHQSATLLTLLQRYAEEQRKILLIAALTRQRPPESSGLKRPWEREIVGGRMSRLKADAILSIEKLPRPKSRMESTVRCDLEYLRNETLRNELPKNLDLQVPNFI
jgi:hypothetical protein